MKKLFKSILVIKVFLCSIFISFNIYGETLNNIEINNIEITEQFGRLTSLEKACDIARDSLFDKARRLAAGEETMTYESANICKFSEQESKCNLYTNSFRSITKVQIIDYEFLKFPDGNECRFSSLGNDIFEATVKGNFVLKKLPQQPDNFNFRILTNKNDFISYPQNKIKQREKNDNIEITLETTEDMYVSIFQWLPYEDTNTIQKIFPNEVDSDNFFKSDTIHSIPTSKKKQNYKFRVDFPNEEYVFDNEIQEFLMAVGTKEQVPFFKTYKYAEFGQKLVEIENFRQKRESYRIRKRTD